MKEVKIVKFEESFDVVARECFQHNGAVALPLGGDGTNNTRLGYVALCHDSLDVVEVAKREVGENAGNVLFYISDWCLLNNTAVMDQVRAARVGMCRNAMQVIIGGQYEAMYAAIDRVNGFIESSDKVQDGDYSFARVLRNQIERSNKDI